MMLKILYVVAVFVLMCVVAGGVPFLFHFGSPWSLLWGFLVGSIFANLGMVGWFKWFEQ